MSRAFKLFIVLVISFGIAITVDFMFFQKKDQTHNQIQTWLDDDGKNGVITGLLESAQQQEKLNVEIKGIPAKTFFLELDTALEEPDAPCIVTLPAMQTKQLRDKLLPLNELIEREQFDTAMFSNSSLSSLTYDDKLYGLPYSVSLVHMFYNKDLFDQAHLPYPTIGYDWATFINDVRTIGELGPDYYGYAASPRLFEATVIGMMYGENDKSFVDGKLNLDSQTNVESLQRIFSLFADPQVLVINTDETESAYPQYEDFIKGRVGMVAGGPWTIDYIKEKQDMNIGFAPLPTKTGKTKGVVTSSGLAITKACAKPGKAFRNIMQMLTPSSIHHVGQEERIIPALADTQETVREILSAEQAVVVQYLVENGIDLEFSTEWDAVEAAYKEVTKERNWGEYSAQDIVNQIVDTYGK